MKKLTIIERKPIQDKLNLLDFNLKLPFIEFINNIDLTPISVSSKIKSIDIFYYILLSNTSDWFNLYTEYRLSKSTVRKLEIKYGKEISNNFSLNLSTKSTGRTPNSWMTPAFWEKKGFSYKDAINEVSKKQSIISKNAHSKKRQNNNNYREYNPLCLDYWITRGFSYNESNRLMTEYKAINSHTVDKFIALYGEIDGKRKFKEKNEKRLKTIFERYGTYTASSGKISKGSIRVFVTLYKAIRKMGVSRDKFNFGITGSSEYVRTNAEIKKTYFYDFVVRDLNIAVEYNGLYWHPRNIDEWRGYGDFYEKTDYDETKNKFIEELGFKLFVIWEDDNFKQKIEEIVEYAKTRMVK